MKDKFRIYKVKSCCGSSTTILETDRPIRKSQAKVFKDAGYFVPENFFQAGVFHVVLDKRPHSTLIVTASYGTNRFSIRCNGSACDVQILAFEDVLEKAINS